MQKIYSNKKHPLVQANSDSSTKSPARKSASPKIPTFQLRRYIKSGRLFIVAKEQTLRKSSNRMRLLRSEVIKVIKANSWFEAKQKFGFEPG